MNSKKYPRTYHLPWSPGATSDDKIAKEIDQVIGNEIVITEKLDGENSCINQYGVFSRSHASPTKHPWANYLWETWQLIGHQLEDLELFGESLYAIHSIEYTGLTKYFYLFAIREMEHWFSWEKIELHADILQLDTVPVLFKGVVQTEEELKKLIDELMESPSHLSGENVKISPKEGVVVRVARGFEDKEFSKCVFKWVRANHVQTDVHWTKNWKRAILHFEQQAAQKKRKPSNP